MSKPRQTVTVVTGPAADPVTLDETKTFCKIDGTDEDALLAGFITAAVEYAEQYLKRSLITQTLKLTLDLPCSQAFDLPDGVYDLPSTVLYAEPPRIIKLPRGPVQSVTSITTTTTGNTTSTYGSDNYQVDAAGSRVFLNDTAFWPSDIRPVAGIAVTYVAGYGATQSSVPMPIKAGIMMHVQRMYDMRLICDLPPECERLYRAYRIYA